MENLLDTYNIIMQCLEKFLRTFENEVSLKNYHLTKNFHPLLETGLHTTTIVCFLSETIFSKSMRNNYESPMEVDLWVARESEYFYFDADWESDRPGELVQNN